MFSPRSSLVVAASSSIIFATSAFLHEPATPCKLCNRGLRADTASLVTLVAEGKWTPRVDGVHPTSYPNADTMFVVPVTVHGRTMPFVVDNGASMGIVSMEALENVGIHLKTKSFLVLDSMFLGSSLLENTWTVALPQNGWYFKTEISRWGNSGLLGRNVLSNYEVEYDIPHSALRLYTLNAPAGSGSSEWGHSPAWLPRELQRTDCFPGHPDTTERGMMTHKSYDLQFPVMVNGRMIMSNFDSGINQTTMNWAEAEAVGLSKTSASVRRIAGDTTGSYFADSVVLKVGNRELSTGPIVISDTKFNHNRNPILLLGLDRFRDRTLFMSFRTAMICIGKPIK